MQTYLRALSFALEAAAEVVHDDVCAAATEEDGVLAAQAATSTRHNDSLAIVSELLGSHGVYMP